MPESPNSLALHEDIDSLCKSISSLSLSAPTVSNFYYSQNMPTRSGVEYQGSGENDHGGDSVSTSQPIPRRPDELAQLAGRSISPRIESAPPETTMIEDEQSVDAVMVTDPDQPTSSPTSSAPGQFSNLKNLVISPIENKNAQSANQYTKSDRSSSPVSKMSKKDAKKLINQLKADLEKDRKKLRALTEELLSSSESSDHEESDDSEKEQKRKQKKKKTKKVKDSRKNKPNTASASLPRGSKLFKNINEIISESSDSSSSSEESEDEYYKKKSKKYSKKDGKKAIKKKDERKKNPYDSDGSLISLISYPSSIETGDSKETKQDKCEKKKKFFSKKMVIELEN